MNGTSYKYYQKPYLLCHFCGSSLDGYYFHRVLRAEDKVEEVSSVLSSLLTNLRLPEQQVEQDSPRCSRCILVSSPFPVALNAAALVPYLLNNIQQQGLRNTRSRTASDPILPLDISRTSMMRTIMKGLFKRYIKKNFRLVSIGIVLCIDDWHWERSSQVKYCL